MTEYGLIIGLVGVLGIAAAFGLGDSIVAAFSNESSPRGATAMMAATKGGTAMVPPGLTDPVSGRSITYAGKGYYKLKINLGTGSPELIVTDGKSGGVTNATSVDGATKVQFFQSTLLAVSLENAAAKMEDPAAASWMNEMAKQIYRMAYTEGIMENYNLADAVYEDTGYTWNNALNDLTYYQGELEKLMTAPPSGLSKETLTYVLAATGDAYNIGQSYKESFADTEADSGQTSQRMDAYIEDAQLRTEARAKLAEERIPIQPVRATVVDGVTVDDART